MEFNDLIDFIENRMKMSHIYQPLLLRILVEAGGTATIRQLAHGFLAQDESQLRFYESRIKKMPVPVLNRRGGISNDGERARFNRWAYKLAAHNLGDGNADGREKRVPIIFQPGL